MNRLIPLILLSMAIPGTAVAGGSESANDNSNKNTMVLTFKQKSLVKLASLEAKGDIPNLEKEIAAALDGDNDAKGLTVNEIKEVFSHLYAYTGFPRALNAQGALQRVLADRQSRGINDETGREASPLPSDYDALKDGTEIQTKLSGKAFNYTFDPSVDYYLKAHLFGDIFARDIFTHPEREIVTISALASIEGLDSQLGSHVRGGHNMGLSDDEIRAIPAVLRESAGEMAAWRAEKAIAGFFGEEFNEGKPVDPMVFPKGEPNTAYAQYFIGNSYLAPLLKEGLPLSNVTFEPRCRNNWHIHHKGGQILICVGGEGWYQEWGKPAQRLKPGDVVNIPAEVKHWHGATADSWFQHIAIAVPAEGASNEWLEPVEDDYYNAL